MGCAMDQTRTRVSGETVAEALSGLYSFVSLVAALRPKRGVSCGLKIRLLPSSHAGIGRASSLLPPQCRRVIFLLRVKLAEILILQLKDTQMLSSKDEGPPTPQTFCICTEPENGGCDADLPKNNCQIEATSVAEKSTRMKKLVWPLMEVRLLRRSLL